MKSDNHQARIMYSRVHHLHSSAVNDTYKIAVWLPPDYEASDDILPCVYVLDEPEFFGFASGVALNYFLHDEHPTQMMIVAIGKELASLDDWWSIRWRDFSPIAVPREPESGHADLFLDFLSTEIMPFIDKQYRTNATNRTLWGHSLGGLFTVYALKQKPDLFRAYIATSPAFVVDGVELLSYKEGLQTELASDTKLFVSVGALEADFKPHVDVFVKAIQEGNYANLDFSYESLAEMEHMPAALMGFINGMRWVMSNE